MEVLSILLRIVRVSLAPYKQAFLEENDPVDRFMFQSSAALTSWTAHPPAHPATLHLLTIKHSFQDEISASDA